MQDRQENIPEGCVPLGDQMYVLWWPPLGDSTGQGGGGWYPRSHVQGVGIHNHPPLVYPGPKGAGTRHTHATGKDLGPDIPTHPPPMNRQTPVKTLPSRNYCCGR